MTYPNKELIRLGLILSALFFMAMITSCGSKDQIEKETDYYEIGMALFKEGFYNLLPEGKIDDAMAKFAQAEKAFKQAAFEDPGSADTRRYLARSYAMQHKHSSAAAEYMKAIEIEPDNFNNYLYLASVYVRMKRYDDALKTLNHAKTLSKESSVIGLIDDLIKKIRDRSFEQNKDDTSPKNL